MGIAGFFIWLQRWYENCIDIIPKEISDAALQGKFVKSGKYERYDNLYIDMNGLVHPCCHDTDPLPEPESEEEMFERIFKQIDLLFNVVRPKKCVVMCVDGVAPRSKMNQQRMRRFRAAEEGEEGIVISESSADLIVKENKLPRPTYRLRWDHNVITPATPFMERLSVAIEWYIVKKLNEDPAWKEITVVFSDDRVPGEGEHKIMEYIRSLRTQPGYDPKTSHVIHGMDADLICLGLATHEENFFILRNQLTERFSPEPNHFCYFNLKKFRERLLDDYKDIGTFDFERVLDDFVYLCFFVGNDFLSHVPLISIKTKGIESLLDHYVSDFEDNGYLTKNGEVKFKRLGQFLSSFVAKKLPDLKKEYLGTSRMRARSKTQVEERVSIMEREAAAVMSSLEKDRSNAQEISNRLLQLHTAIRKERLRHVAGSQPLGFSYADKDFRDDYYKCKFGWDVSTEGREAVNAKIKRCAREYLRGTQWVMRYYTKGCPSWSWFYPYHYAPLLEDLAQGTDNVNVEMEMSQPLHPVEQLLAVLPRQSKHAIPEVLHSHIMNPKSVLGQFYPDGKVQVDFSEANFSYQGVIRLPFIDCDELRKACASLVTLEPDIGRALLFAHAKSQLAQGVESALQKKRGASSSSYSEPNVPLTEEVASVTPIGGFVGRFEDEYEQNCGLRCPDEGIASIKTYGSPIKRNHVRCFTYSAAPKAAAAAPSSPRTEKSTSVASPSKKKKRTEKGANAAADGSVIVASSPSEEPSRRSKSPRGSSSGKSRKRGRGAESEHESRGKENEESSVSAANVSVDDSPAASPSPKRRKPKKQRTEALNTLEQQQVHHQPSSQRESGNGANADASQESANSSPAGKRKKRARKPQTPTNWNLDPNTAAANTTKPTTTTATSSNNDGSMNQKRKKKNRNSAVEDPHGSKRTRVES